MLSGLDPRFVYQGQTYRVTKHEYSAVTLEADFFPRSRQGEVFVGFPTLLKLWSHLIMFGIGNRKLYKLIRHQKCTLSLKETAVILEQLKSGFPRLDAGTSCLGTGGRIHG